MSECGHPCPWAVNRHQGSHLHGALLAFHQLRRPVAPADTHSQGARKFSRSVLKNHSLSLLSLTSSLSLSFSTFYPSNYLPTSSTQSTNLHAYLHTVIPTNTPAYLLGCPFSGPGSDDESLEKPDRSPVLGLTMHAHENLET
jgi:hypothetical protein